MAVDNLLALELTRAIGEGEGEEVDLRRLTDFRWDRGIVVAPGTPREAVSEALGSQYRGDLPYGSTGRLFVFADGSSLARFADYRGRSTFNGFERPLDALPREQAVLRVSEGVVAPARAAP